MIRKEQKHKGLIRDFPARIHARVEFSDPEKIYEIQCKILQKHVRYVAEHSPYYKALFKNLGVSPGFIRSPEDLLSIPLTEKTDLEEHNKDFLCVSQEEIVDVCLTSGTTREVPTLVLHTESDLARLAYNEEMAFGMLGISREDTLLVCAALDRCFIAGLAYYLGGLKLGARMIRGGSSNAVQAWRILKFTGATAIVGVPSFMRKIGEYALEIGEDPRNAGVRSLAGIGEPVRDKNLEILPGAKRLEDIWGAHVYSTYASTELATTFCECPARQGGHLRLELIVLEILDDAGKPVPVGDPGEIVATPLGVTGMPLLRFRTGDISFIRTEPCQCGRRTQRLGPILGRKNQMLKYKGTTLFPNTLLGVIEGFREVSGSYIEVRRNPDGTDRVILALSARSDALPLEHIKEELRAHARVAPEIILVSEEELNKKTNPPDKRKRVTFFDMRGNSD